MPFYYVCRVDTDFTTKKCLLLHLLAKEFKSGKIRWFRAMPRIALLVSSCSNCIVARLLDWAYLQFSIGEGISHYI